MSEKNTQLTNASGYDVSRIRFSKPILGSIPDSKPAISFQRINISTQNGLIQGISHKFCKRIHAKDGYSYAV